MSFTEALDATTEGIRAHPEAYGRHDNDVRLKTLRGFPYAVYYRDSEDEILILAVAHTSRLPGYWEKRRVE